LRIADYLRKGTEGPARQAATEGIEPRIPGSRIRSKFTILNSLFMSRLAGRGHLGFNGDMAVAENQPEKTA
jgi:hypothetical protein